MLPSQQNKYLETSIQSATPAQLLIMLYDGAIRFCRMGIDSTKKGNIEDAHKYFCKTQDIVQEFIITLDGDRQNDPADIPKLVAGIENADMVCGHRINRKDPWSKKITSALANFVRSRVCQDPRA